MSAYVLAMLDILNPEDYEEYRRQVPPSIEKYGGRFAARGGKFEKLEGEWNPSRVVVLEFPSFERAKEWYNSPEYQKVLPIRQRNSRTGIVGIVEGI